LEEILMFNPSRLFILTAASLAVLGLSACTAEETATRPDPAPMRQASNAAETACMSAVNGNYGGQVRELTILRSEFSEANSEVVINAIGVRGGSQSERWRCLSSTDGQIAELTVLP
jgi:hypothetical protein